MGNGNKHIKEAVRQRKSKKVAFAVTVAAIAAAGSALFWLGRDTSAPPQPPPPMEEPPIKAVKDDGVCAEKEAYPCKLNEDGTEKREKGNCIEPNPHYSKADCYWGDGVCDDDKEKVLDSDGKEHKLPKHYVSRKKDGSYEEDEKRPITLPLEDEESPDCQMELAREERCEMWTGDNPIGNREHGISVEYERWRTPDEVREQHAAPQKPPLSDVDKRIDVQYGEVCREPSKDFPLCDPDKPKKECACPNLPDPADCGEFRKKEPHCGNGIWEPKKQEQCDPGSEKGKKKCGEGETCTKTCRCVEVKKEPICGDTAVNGTEQCDYENSTLPRQGCPEDHKCNRQCVCEKVEPPPPPPKPKVLKMCESWNHDVASAMWTTIWKRIKGDAGKYWNLVAGGADSTVRASGTAIVNTDGTPTSAFVSISCTGNCTQSSTPGPKIPVSILEGKLGGQSEECKVPLGTKKISSK